MKLLIRQDADFAGFAFPDDRGFVFSPGGDVTIETVVGEIDLSADEPLGPRAIPLENAIPLLEPVQFAGEARPECVGIVDGLLVEALVFFQTFYVCVAAELRGRLEFALLLQDGIDVGGVWIDDSFLGHLLNLNAEEILFAPNVRRIIAGVYSTQGMADVIGITGGIGRGTGVLIPWDSQLGRSLRAQVKACAFGMTPSQ